MNWQNKINDWRSRNDAEKQQLAVTFAVLGTGLIFIMWLFVVAFDLSAPVKPVTQVVPSSVEVVSPKNYDKKSFWQNVSSGVSEAVLSVWQGIVVTTNKAVGK